MHKLKLLVWVLLPVLVLEGNKLAAQEKEEVQMANENKILIAYYSYSGNTKQVAEAIQKETGGSLFEIKAATAYPTDYHQMSEQAKKEIEQGVRPPLTEQVANINEYDVIFVGSPCWWGTITPQVSSFLESSQLTGKTVIPFITHGGGGVMNTVKDLTAQCKGCEVSDKPWIGYGSRTAGVAAWIKGLGLSE